MLFVYFCFVESLHVDYFTCEIKLCGLCPVVLDEYKTTEASIARSPHNIFKHPFSCMFWIIVGS